MKRVHTPTAMGRRSASLQTALRWRSRLSPLVVATLAATAGLLPSSSRAEQATAPQQRGRPVLTVEDACLKPSGSTCANWSMDSFDAALERLESSSPRGLVRVSHFGDSLTADDHIPARVRERLQERFGDGGAGFVFLAQPTRWPQKQSGSRTRSDGFDLRSIVGDGGRARSYGLGGAAFDGAGVATVLTAHEGSGSRASHIELSYLAQPRGGTMALTLDGKALAPVATAAKTATPGFQRIDTDDGPHRLGLRVTRGAVRVYGVTLERDHGLVWENLALISASSFHLARMDLAAWSAQLEHRAADLNVVFLGANDIDFLDGGHADAMASEASLERYRASFTDLLGAIRAGRPNGACLVMGPIELTGIRHGARRARATLASLIEIQRSTAKAQGCAFWDTHAWMGGAGSAVRWRRDHLLAGDWAHLTPEGGARLADGLADALLAGLDGWRARAGAARVRPPSAPSAASAPSVGAPKASAPGAAAIRTGSR